MTFGGVAGTCTGVAETCPVLECATCGERDCPKGEPLHYHHDGCPACDLPGEGLQALFADQEPPRVCQPWCGKDGENYCSPACVPSRPATGSCKHGMVALCQRCDTEKLWATIATRDAEIADLKRTWIEPSAGRKIIETAFEIRDKAVAESERLRAVTVAYWKRFGAVPEDGDNILEAAIKRETAARTELERVRAVLKGLIA